MLKTSGIKDLFDVVAIVEVEDAAEIRRIVAEEIQPIHGVLDQHRHPDLKAPGTGYSYTRPGNERPHTCLNGGISGAPTTAGLRHVVARM